MYQFRVLPEDMDVWYFYLMVIFECDCISSLLSLLCRCRRILPGTEQDSNPSLTSLCPSTTRDW